MDILWSYGAVFSEYRERISTCCAKLILEVDLFIPSQMKYEFDIDANTGKIIDQDADYWEADDHIEYGYLLK